MTLISIHSLVKRETKAPCIVLPCGGDFNPLPRKEGDFCSHLFAFVQQKISIHSLVKRETLYAFRKLSAEQAFQSTPS